MIIGPLQQSWLDELKSRRHNHIVGKLARLSNDAKTIVGECCLGVACFLFNIPWEPSDNNNFAVFKEMDCENTAYATPTVTRKLKLFSQSGMLGGMSPAETIGSTVTLRSLAEINDQESSYDKVIWVIENHPEWIFSEAA